jgi:hypothetical protein
LKVRKKNLSRRPSKKMRKKNKNKTKNASILPNTDRHLAQQPQLFPRCVPLPPHLAYVWALPALLVFQPLARMHESDDDDDAMRKLKRRPATATSCLLLCSSTPGACAVEKSTVRHPPHSRVFPSRLSHCCSPSMAGVGHRHAQSLLFAGSLLRSPSSPYPSPRPSSPSQPNSQLRTSHHQLRTVLQQPQRTSQHTVLQRTSICICICIHPASYVRTSQHQLQRCSPRLVHLT